MTHLFICNNKKRTKRIQLWGRWWEKLFLFVWNIWFCTIAVNREYYLFVKRGLGVKGVNISTASWTNNLKKIILLPSKRRTVKIWSLRKRMVHFFNVKILSLKRLSFFFHTFFKYSFVWYFIYHGYSFGLYLERHLIHRSELPSWRFCAIYIEFEFPFRRFGLIVYHVFKCSSCTTPIYKSLRNARQLPYIIKNNYNNIVFFLNPVIIFLF